VRNLIPIRFRSNYDAFFEQVNRVVNAYFRGQLLVATILSFLYGTAFWMAGLSFGFVIGVLTGCLNVIPYVGPLVGLSTATIVSLSHFEGVSALLKVWSAFAIVQGLESFVITPRIVGDRVGLSALETMIAVIVGGNLGGFVGMVVAIPTAGIIRALLLECRSLYLRSEFYVRNPS
jgi:predicted PurR-regulated permease PerM